MDLMQYDDLVIEQRGFCFAYAIRHMYIYIYTYDLSNHMFEITGYL